MSEIERLAEVAAKSGEFTDGGTRPRRQQVLAAIPVVRALLTAIRDRADKPDHGSWRNFDVVEHIDAILNEEACPMDTHTLAALSDEDLGAYAWRHRLLAWIKPDAQNMIAELAKRLTTEAQRAVIDAQMRDAADA